MQPLFSRHLNDWELERIEEFLLRLQGKEVRRNEDNRLQWMGRKEGEISSQILLLFVEVGKRGCFPYKGNLELNGYDQSRFLFMGSF